MPVHDWLLIVYVCMYVYVIGALQQFTFFSEPCPLIRNVCRHRLSHTHLSVSCAEACNTFNTISHLCVLLSVGLLGTTLTDRSMILSIRILLLYRLLVFLVP